MITPSVDLLAHLNRHPAVIASAPVNFATLPDWQQDDHRQALVAFQNSCRVLLKSHRTYAISNEWLPLTSEHWRPVCQAALITPQKDLLSARVFFEKWFTPVVIKSKGRTPGYFTGYFTPYVKGSLYQHDEFQVPIYAKPNGYNCTRAMINQGGLAGKARILAWVRSRIDRFFLQTQGSGVLLLDEGGELHLGYGGKNSWPYTPISKILLRKGFIGPDNISMFAVKQWLYRHPKIAYKLMNYNASFVYFQKQITDHVLGIFNVPLTPQRSLAVDRSIIPFGVPIWIDTYFPPLQKNTSAKPFRRLLIAQDTGSAIKGVVRGDIYMGLGMQAQIAADKMKYPGQYWLFIPRQKPKTTSL